MTSPSTVQCPSRRCVSSADGRDSSRAIQERYVRAVLAQYLALPGVPARVSRLDRRCAKSLHERGVPLPIVRAALLLATARRTFRTGEPLPPVRALHYFIPVVEELLAQPPEPSYIEYLADKIERLTPVQSAMASSTYR